MDFFLSFSQTTTIVSTHSFSTLHRDVEAVCFF